VLLTLNKAAQTCGHAKSTLLDAIRSGRLTAPKDDRGRYAIDPAELHRVFPFQVSDRPESRSGEPQPTPGANHPTTTVIPADPRAEVLAREVELLREALTRSEENAERWRIMVERQQALLEDRRQAGERPRPKGFLRRFLGR
jgi:hypothetical protein